MATFRWGAGGQIVGAIGATVFQRGRFGGVARNRTPPVQPSTARQQTVKSAMSLAAQLWFNMSPDDRAAWELYAEGTPWLNRLGDTSYLTGLQHFNRRAVAEYVQIVAAGGPTPISLSTLPPTLVGLPTIPVITINADLNGPALEITGANIAVGAGEWLLVSWTYNIKPTRNYYKGPYLYTNAQLGDITFPVNFDPVPTNMLLGFTVRASARFADQYGRLSQIGYSQTTVVDTTPPPP